MSEFYDHHTLMETEIIHRFLKKFKSDRFSLAYMGEFDDNMTSSLMKSNETSIDEPKKFKKKLSYLIAECFQNTIRHGDKPALLTQTNNKPKVFILRNRGNIHYISSTNLIANTKRDDLQLKLRSINVLTPEDLKDVYMAALVNNEISSKGGGGLGLIEMARKSGYPLEFAFDVINYFFSVFFFQVCFITEDEARQSKAVDPADKISIDQTREIYDMMLAENVLLLRKGDFSQESILPVIELMDTSLNAQPDLPGGKKKTMYLLVEMLQNISKHGASVNGERKGIFMISRKNNGYALTAGNYIDVNDVETLKSKLESVVNLDESGLKWAYKNALLKESGDKTSAGIGLIEMCKYSKERIKYSFKPENETTMFFSLSVHI